MNICRVFYFGVFVKHLAGSRSNHDHHGIYIIFHVHVSLVALYLNYYATGLDKIIPITKELHNFHVKTVVKTSLKDCT